jgi:serine/threonine-protein kinase
VEVKYAQQLLANGRTADANAELAALLQRVRRSEGEDSENYALVLEAMVEAALRSGDAANGQKLLDETRARYTKRGLPPTHARFAQFLRYDAAFARMRGDLVSAEARQREALQRLQVNGNPFDIAAARAELAQIRFERGDRAEPRNLLAQALPVLRESVLPQETSRAAAEALARKLAM